MKAKIILETINNQMTKDQILALVQQAADDMELLDKHDIARELDRNINAIRKAADTHNIGTKMRGQRIFTPSDIEIFKKAMTGPGRPKKHK